MGAAVATLACGALLLFLIKQRRVAGADGANGPHWLCFWEGRGCLCRWLALILVACTHSAITAGPTAAHLTVGAGSVAQAGATSGGTVRSLTSRTSLGAVNDTVVQEAAGLAAKDDTSVVDATLATTTEGGDPVALLDVALRDHLSDKIVEKL